MHTTKPREMWTLDDVADYTGLSKPTLYGLRHEGRGPTAYRLGRRLRFREADVLAWVEAQRDQPRPALGA